jgi:N-acetylneuraminic acid mutarotase
MSTKKEKSMKANIRFLYPPPVVKMLSMLIMALVLMGVSSLSFADKWEQKADMLAPNCQFAACEFNNEIYIFGGAAGQTRVEKYNPVSNTWEKRADMPHSRLAGMAAEVNGKIYVFGNCQNETPVDVYDPVSNTWETKSDMPNSFRGLAGIAVLNDKVYIIGGFSNTNQTTYPDIDVYDTKTDTWEKKKPSPIPRDSFGACAVNGKIYIISGYTPNGDVSTVWEYEPIQETWTKKTDIPTIRDAFTVNVIAGKIYCIGGFNFNINQTALSTFDVYDQA